MKRYKIALFDLDGTLTDSAQGITNSIMFALNKFDRKIADRTALYPFIGPPLLESFQKYYSFSPEQAEKAVDYYREYFSEKGIFENRVYDGVPEMLADLKNGGMRLAVASAKPEIYTKRILKHFGLDGFFHFIGGAKLNGTRRRKEEVVRYVLDFFDGEETRETVMIGDRQDDISGAKKNRLDSIGVLYGFGSRSELQTAGADYLVESVGELHGQLLNGLRGF